MKRVRLLLKQCARLRSLWRGEQFMRKRMTASRNELQTELARANARIKEIESLFSVRLNYSHEYDTYRVCLDISRRALASAKLDTMEFLGHVASQLIQHLRKEQR